MSKPSEILIYKNQLGDINLDVLLDDDTVWLSQIQISDLFNKAKSTISEHIKHIFDEGELNKKAVVREFRTTATDGKNYDTHFYNLDVIISVGYRVKSLQGTQFRIWATQRLKDHIVKGFTLNDARFKNGTSMNYFDELQERIRQIRLSEQFFYQKIKDIYTTSIDYNPKDQQSILFFKTVQNKLLWAISQQTAAELIVRRADASQPLMGMLALDKTTVIKKDVSIAKNYLNEDEIKLLGLLVEQYLAFAQTMAQQQTPMTMKTWMQRLDAIISLNGRELLNHAGKITHKLALEQSALEYKKYKQEQKKHQKEQSLQTLEQDIKRLQTK